MLDLNLMDKIAATTKRQEKEAFLARQPESAKEIFKRVCSPDITFGVTVDEQTAVGRWRMINTRYVGGFWWTSLLGLLDDLAARKITGNAALGKVDELLRRAPSEQHCRWGCRIINRDLRAGFTGNTVNKVWKGLVPKFAVALANKLKDYKKGLNGLWYLEPKIDGLRCVIVGGKAYTRTGKDIKTAGHVIAELPSAAQDYVLDGELMGVGAFEDTMSQIRNGKKAGENAKKLVFNIFDCVRADEWAAKQSRRVSDRKNDIVELFAPKGDGKVTPHIKVVPWKHVDNPSDETVQQLHDMYVMQGYEGLMIKAEAGYEWKRSNAVLKMKTFVDIDLPIAGFVEGEGKYVGMMGTMVVDDHGIKSEVGTGFTDEHRRIMWEMREQLVGQVVELCYQNKTKEGKLRIAVFKGLRTDKDADESEDDCD